MITNASFNGLMKRTDLLTGGAKQDQQARGQVDGTVDLNNAIKVPDKTEIVPDTIKKCRIVAMKCQIRQRKGRCVSGKGENSYPGRSKRIRPDGYGEELS